MKKGIISILLAISIMITIGAPMTFADGNTTLGTITVGNATVEQGTGDATVEIPVEFKGSVNLSAFEFKVNFDEEIKYESTKVGTLSDDIQYADKGSKFAGFVFLKLNNNTQTFNDGSFGTIVFTVPKENAKVYELTIDFVGAMGDNNTKLYSSNFNTVNGLISVVPPSTPSDPEITFKDGSGAEVNKVVEGTMELTVDLNGADYDLVLFAIYSTGTHPYVEMKYVETATLSDGVYKATITNIEIESDKDYYAKAFVWNTSDYLGICETISENN